jgi:hypothetical protein
VKEEAEKKMKWRKRNRTKFLPRGDGEPGRKGGRENSEGN